MRFTDIAIRALKLPEKGQRDHWDDSIKGFGVRVSQGGTKTFILIVNGNRRSLGRFPLLSLAEARQEARKILAQQELGRTFTPTTFADALDQYIEQVKKKNRPSTAYEAERVLRRHYAFGSRRLDTIRATEIMRIIDKLSPSSANHAFAQARSFFRWCVRRQYIDRHPLEAQVLPHKTASRDRFLSDNELATIWYAARAFPFPFGDIVALLILTGQRLGEIAALRWEYIDAERQVITLPASLAKNNTAHTFPFGELVKALLDGIPKTSEFLFPAKTGVTFYDGQNKAKGRLEDDCNIVWAKRVNEDQAEMQHWTLHDLRRAFSTIHARIGTAIDIQEALLNHKSRSRSSIQRIYDRYDRLEPMRIAMRNYEEHLTKLFPAVPTPP